MNLTAKDYEAFGHQCAVYLSNAGAVAGDAQIDAAFAAIGVLRVSEGREQTGDVLAGAGRIPTPTGRDPRRPRIQDGMTHSDGVGEVAS